MDNIELMAIVDKERPAGMSRAGYASFLGIHKSYYSRLLSGERQPSIAFLKKLNYRLPKLWPEIQQYLAGLAENLASKQANMALIGSPEAIDRGGDT